MPHLFVRFLTYKILGHKAHFGERHWVLVEGIAWAGSTSNLPNMGDLRSGLIGRLPDLRKPQKSLYSKHR